MAVVAKFKVQDVKYFTYATGSQDDLVGGEVRLSPVKYDKDHPENKIFGMATPSGEIRMMIMNLDTINEFMKALGQEMTVTFQKVRKQ